MFRPIAAGKAEAALKALGCAVGKLFISVVADAVLHVRFDIEAHRGIFSTISLRMKRMTVSWT
jgi:hypothetical protein